MSEAFQGYDLVKISKVCSELGLSCRMVDADFLEVTFSGDVVLYFANDRKSSRVEAGIAGTPWRFDEGVLSLRLGDGQYAYFDEYEMLRSIVSGDILLVTQLRNGKIQDRWLTHKEEPLEIRLMKPGEELRVTRLNGHAGPGK